VNAVLEKAKNPSCRGKISELPGEAVVIVVIVNWQYNTSKCFLFDEFVSWILCRVLQQRESQC
jgi:hypothetical protein